MVIYDFRLKFNNTHALSQVKRFAEAFFTMDNPRSAATGCFDNAPQRYMAVTEAVRRSPYLQVSRDRDCVGLNLLLS